MNEYDFPKSFGFLVVYQDKKLCHTTVIENEVRTVTFSKYQESRLFQMYLHFVKTNKREDVITFLMSRTIEETNPRWCSLYKRVGLKNYKL